MRKSVVKVPAIAAGGAPANPLRLQHDDFSASLGELPSSSEAGEAAADHCDVVVAIDRTLSGPGKRRGCVVPVGEEFHVSLKVEKGRNLGIIGESGCGKSTLARAIAGILPAAAGKIVFDGKELGRSARERSRDELREMQIVFQYADTALNPAKSVEDILARPLTFYHGMNAKARNARIDELLDMVSIGRTIRRRRAHLRQKKSPDRTVSGDRTAIGREMARRCVRPMATRRDWSGSAEPSKGNAY